ncbi:MAG: hypothetical protein A2719_05450 [Candidatus Ryanbacteria bacterium RIFCSPHIGHO2_01_FULL_45_22]|uniref:Uncharacterized protein n=2 Tax=Candidatus Ryaniibacteriota TaxID=1817914 RepID=A0A1G2FZ30_9BACT|nr:MAG: hypothetical protein A2719_05450 [Candidatus Ryanbacteria bacterium RIFCSPHIGHO2_01_FULL_45_22]OGZ45398.1 MAG: hypothetical protein A3J54_00925 [Candidatus Ryanbacteria bacterium RIFCSPHIGHO2_02_FULL_45_13b]
MIEEMPIRTDFEVDDFKIVGTYVQQALTSRGFMPARPPQEALGRVRCFFRVMLHGNPECLLSVALPRLHIYLKVLQRKYCVVSDWHQTFLSAWLFLEKLGACGNTLTRDDKTCGEEVLRMLEELQSEDTAVSAAYAQLGVHLNS